MRRCIFPIGGADPGNQQTGDDQHHQQRLAAVKHQHPGERSVAEATAPTAPLLINQGTYSQGGESESRRESGALFSNRALFCRLGARLSCQNKPVITSTSPWRPERAVGTNQKLSSHPLRGQDRAKSKITLPPYLPTDGERQHPHVKSMVQTACIMTCFGNSDV